MINLFSRKKPDNIVFLVGCGRSGTTLLSSLVGSCSNTHILSERRDLWHKVFPELNIWDNINSVLDFKTSDYNTKKNEKIRSVFFREAESHKKNNILEKLPINCFRLNFINEAFPEAKYIVIKRSPLEVAASIEEKIGKGNWYGVNDNKLRLLIEYAKSNNVETKDFLKTDFNKGLLEWKLSNIAISKFFNDSKKDFFLINYSNLTLNPKEILTEALNFLEIKYNEEALINCCKLVHKNLRNNENIKNNIQNNQKEFLISEGFIQEK